MSMRSTGYSRYKHPEEAVDFLMQWAQQLQQLNGMPYELVTLRTDWGQTVVWVHTPKRRVYETLVFFPAFHSTALAWDINHALAPLKKNYRLCLVEINGQPGLSDGHSPALDTDEYGLWAAQVIELLGTSNATVIGHALGGLICLKVCRSAPQLIKRAILINPVGIHSPTLSFSLLRYYWLTSNSPDYNRVQAFLQKLVFSEMELESPLAYEKLMIDYQVYVFSEFNHTAFWQRALPKDELLALRTKLYIIVGAQDKLVNYQGTLERAIQYISSLQSVTVLPGMGHAPQRNEQVILNLQAILLHKSQRPATDEPISPGA